MVNQVEHIVPAGPLIYVVESKFVSILPTNSSVVPPYVHEMRHLADKDLESETIGGTASFSDPFTGSSTLLAEEGSLLQHVLDNFSRIGRVIDSLNARRLLDRSEGFGLVEGARSFGGQVAAQYSLESGHSSFLTSILTLLSGGPVSLSSAPLSKGGIPDVKQEMSDLLTNSTLGSVLTGIQSDLAGASHFPAAFATPLGGASAAGGLQAASSLYQLFDNWGQMDPKLSAISGAASGAYIGSTIMPGVGTAIGAVIGGVVGAVGGFMKTGKHDDQLARDQVRTLLQRQGWLDENYSVRLADGSTYNIGKDGGHQLPNTDGSTRRAYEIDTGNLLSHDVIGMIKPFVSALLGGNPKLTSDFTGYLANAALSNASTLEDAKRNIHAIIEQFQLDPGTAIGGIIAMTEQGILSRGVRDAYLNGIRSLYSSTT